MTTNLENVFTEIRGAFDTGNGWHATENAIVGYLLDLFAQDDFETVQAFAEQMESASCSAGSFGEDTIYTARILEKLGDADWRDAIERAVEGYMDAIGETPNFGDSYDGQGFHLENVVTFAVDWFAGEIANWCRGQDTFYVAVLDAEDTWCERHAFTTAGEADDCVAEAISARMEMEMQTATEAWTEEQEQEIRETVESGFYVETERLN